MFLPRGARSTLNHLAFEIPPESYEAHKTGLGGA